MGNGPKGHLHQHNFRENKYMLMARYEEKKSLYFVSSIDGVNINSR